jgi:ceramide glucosyltransferase
MPKTQPGIVSVLSNALAVLYAADRLLKLAAVVDFFARQPPPPPASWPSVTLIQPITRGAHDLANVLACRAALRYAGPVQHLLVCDRTDAATQTQGRAWQSAHPTLDVTILPVDSIGGVASKVAKMQAALPHATGEVLCFVDDDVAPRPDALAILVAHLQPADVGAVFGLACYTNWRNIPSSLMSGFVNANALLSYIPLAYLTAPYTITGHLFALSRRDFAASGGLDGLDEAARIDDDHELARRVRRAGLRCVQTPVIYDVHNDFAAFLDYANQMRRWFVIPKQTMVPQLTRYEQLVSLVGSLGNLLLPLLALLALASRSRQALTNLAGSTALFAAVYALSQRRWLHRRTPLRRWPWVIAAAFLAPLQALAAFGAGDTFTWRGVRYRLHKGGRMERIG